MKKIIIYIAAIVAIISIIVFGIILNNQKANDYDQRLEPVIIRVSGMTMYKENSEILSIIQYYNEEDELYYYEVEFGYDDISNDGDEVTYELRSGVLIINHDIPGDLGEFYFTPELELDKYKDARDQINLTKSIYIPIASYTKEELSLITEQVLTKNGYNN